jgi:hypothetical protein
VSLRFQKRVSILPGVRLNFSMSGVSATIGVPGASVTVGGSGGPTANLGIPESGLSIRLPLNGLPDGGGEAQPRPTPIPFSGGELPALRMTSIQSNAVETLTTAELAPLRNLMLEARQSRGGADREVAEANRALTEAERDAANASQDKQSAEIRSAELDASWFRFLRKGSIAATSKRIEQASARVAEARERIAAARAKKQEAEEHRDSLWIDTEFHLSGPAHGAWGRVVEAFDALSKSQRIWDVTATRGKAAGERTIATSIIARKPTKLSRGALPIIQSSYTPLCWHNANGGDLYLLPGLVAVFQSDEQFALLDLTQVEAEFQGVKFQEEEECPTDAERVGVTWRYTNKNGSPDRRFADNPEIAVLRYAEIHWKSATSLSEAFQFSNARAAALFADRLEEFRNAVMA